jgi:hypothetical protein
MATARQHPQTLRFQGSREHTPCRRWQAPQRETITTTILAAAAAAARRQNVARRLGQQWTPSRRLLNDDHLWRSSGIDPTRTGSSALGHQENNK